MHLIPSTRILLCSAVIAVAAACSDSNNDNASNGFVDTLAPAGEVSERFVSFAVDVDQLAGGTFWDPAGGPDVVAVEPYDFSRERLRNLAAALAPAYMRLGGSASDRTYYDLSDAPVTEPPPGFELVLDRAEWDAAHAFARDLGFEVIFTVNAGSGPRAADGRWDPANAAALLEYTTALAYPLAALEFGNELNLFAIRANLSGYTAPAFADDLATFRALRDAAAPDVPLFAPGNIYMRTQGENIVGNVVFGPRATEVFPLIGTLIDGASYHYYGGISTRCPPSGPRVTLATALDAAYIDGIDEPADATEALRDAHAPGLPIWLMETGGQSCGGQPGVVDRFANTFWFLNTLGRLAQRNHSVVVRQTLSGSSYGLIDDVTLAPRPDYWAALLWRKLMGTRVLALPEVDVAPDLRLYAHCQRDGESGAVTLLAINLGRAQAATVPLHKFGLPREAKLYVGTAADLDSETVAVNGSLLEPQSDGTPVLPSAAPHDADLLEIPAQSWLFAVFPAARVSACRPTREGQ